MARPSWLLKGVFLEEVKFKKNLKSTELEKGPSGSEKVWFGAFDRSRIEVQRAISVLTRQAGE